MLNPAWPVPIASRALLAAALAVLAAPAASAQMPDARQMHGQAIPASELPAGGVTVRVVRESLGNNLPGVPVELHGAGEVRRADTGADGRAQFAGIPVGQRVHAVAVVDGERLESVAFTVPPSGGIRAILVAGLGLGGTSPATSPAPSAGSPGAAGGGGQPLSFGNNTRLAIEFQDDTIAVFYLLEIVNSTGAPAPVPSPLVIELPAEAVAAAMLDGASPLASLAGRQVTIAGPIPPGTTSVPVAFRFESWEARHAITQAFPLDIDQVAVGIQRLSGLTVESPHAASVREATLSGQAFYIANGPSLPAGTPLTLVLAGLPHRSPWPLRAALLLAGAVAALGLYLAVSSPPVRGEARRRQLEARRARGLSELSSLDAAHRAGTVKAAVYEARRARVVAELERIYSELDALGGPPEGVAA